MPDFYERKGKLYHDFESRIACIRECFEETNILISELPAKQPDLRESLDKECAGSFVKFVQKFGVEPALNQLFAYIRLGPPFSEDTQISTQFYLCFSNDEIDGKVLGRDIKLQTSEFSEYKWLSVKAVLDLYERSQLDLFPPQFFMMTFLLMKQQTFAQLLANANKRNREPMAYIPERCHKADLGLVDPKFASRQIREFFDEWDLQPD